MQVILTKTKLLSVVNVHTVSVRNLSTGVTPCLTVRCNMTLVSCMTYCCIIETSEQFVSSNIIHELHNGLTSSEARAAMMNELSSDYTHTT